MVHLGFDVFAGLVVPSKGFAQLVAPFVYANPLAFWGAIVSEAYAKDNMKAVVICVLAGGFALGGWGQHVQSVALDYCKYG